MLPLGIIMLCEISQNEKVFLQPVVQYFTCMLIPKIYETPNFTPLIHKVIQSKINFPLVFSAC